MTGCGSQQDRDALMRDMRQEAQEQLDQLERRIAEEHRPMTDKEREEHDRLFLRVKRYAEGRL